MDNNKIRELLDQLSKEIKAAGGTTASLLEELPPTSDAEKIINEIDSQLSVWEDDIDELIKAL